MANTIHLPLPPPSPLASAVVLSKAVALLFLIQCLLLRPLFCRVMYNTCFVVQYLVPLLVCNHLTGKEIVGCFTCIAFLLPFLCHVTVISLCLFPVVSETGLQCVIVAFPG